MNQHIIDLAEKYYAAIKDNNIAACEELLHPDVQFSAPLAKLQGKEAVVKAITGFAAFIKNLTVRASFGSGDRAMIAYDVDFPAPIGMIPSAALITFKNGLITHIELFYDARPFEKK